MLMPGSLSLMKGGFPALQSSSLVSRTFLAQTFPWIRCFSSCRWRETEVYVRTLITFMPHTHTHNLLHQSQQRAPHNLIQSILRTNLVPYSYPYQEVHSLGKLLRHLQLPQDVYWILVLLQVGVQWTKLHILLNHDVWKENILAEVKNNWRILVWHIGRRRKLWGM